MPTVNELVALISEVDVVRENTRAGRPETNADKLNTIRFKIAKMIEQEGGKAPPDPLNSPKTHRLDTAASPTDSTPENKKDLKEQIPSRVSLPYSRGSHGENFRAP